MVMPMAIIPTIAKKYLKFWASLTPCEKLSDNAIIVIKNGIIIGKLNIAISAGLLDDFEAMAAITVRRIDKPKDPNTRVPMKPGRSTIGFPRKRAYAENVTKEIISKRTEL